MANHIDIDEPFGRIMPGIHPTIKGGGVAKAYDSGINGVHGIAPQLGYPGPERVHPQQDPITVSCHSVDRLPDDPLPYEGRELFYAPHGGDPSAWKPMPYEIALAEVDSELHDLTVTGVGARTCMIFTTMNARRVDRPIYFAGVTRNVANAGKQGNDGLCAIQTGGTIEICNSGNEAFNPGDMVLVCPFSITTLDEHGNEIPSIYQEAMGRKVNRLHRFLPATVPFTETSLDELKSWMELRIERDLKRWLATGGNTGRSVSDWLTGLVGLLARMKLVVGQELYLYAQLFAHKYALSRATYSIDVHERVYAALLEARSKQERVADAYNKSINYSTTERADLDVYGNRGIRECDVLNKAITAKHITTDLYALLTDLNNHIDRDLSRTWSDYRRSLMIIGRTTTGGPVARHFEVLLNKMH